MVKTLLNRVKEGGGCLAISVPLYVISSMCSPISPNEFHKYIRRASKGMIDVGVGLLTNNIERCKRGKEVMDKARDDYPRIYNQIY